MFLDQLWLAGIPISGLYRLRRRPAKRHLALFDACLAAGPVRPLSFSIAMINRGWWSTTVQIVSDDPSTATLLAWSGEDLVLSTDGQPTAHLFLFPREPQPTSLGTAIGARRSTFLDRHADILLVVRTTETRHLEENGLGIAVLYIVSRIWSAGERKKKGWTAKRMKTSDGGIRSVTDQVGGPQTFRAGEGCLIGAVVF